MIRLCAFNSGCLLHLAVCAAHRAPAAVKQQQERMLRVDRHLTTDGIQFWSDSTCKAKLPWRLTADLPV
eukprot:3562152-Amphidinium_carterae.1